MAAQLVEREGQNCAGRRQNAPAQHNGRPEKINCCPISGDANRCNVAEAAAAAARRVRDNNGSSDFWLPSLIHQLKRALQREHIYLRTLAL